MSRSVLVIGKLWPEPTASAAGKRMMTLIHYFISHEWQVFFASASNKAERAIDLAEIGVIEVGLELNSESADQVIRDLNPTAVLFDRFMTEEQFGWKVAKNCLSAVRLLDTEDLHCLREGRRSASRSDTGFNTKVLLNEPLALRELASIYRSDMTIMISEFEVEILKNRFKLDDSLLHYLPFLEDELSEKQVSKWPTYSSREHFIMIGNFLHPPNLDSVQYLKKDVWPLILKELPDVQMHVYGAYATENHLKLTDKASNFYVHGWVEDAHAAMANARVCLAPLRFGAGLKGKLLDAMMNGTPSVTTSIGAEGMNGPLPWPGIIEDDPARFAEAAVKLYCDQELWTKAQGNARQLVNGRFNRRKLEEEFSQRLAHLQSNLPKHRSLNFIGAMLNHHTLRSTEFMSRWIEAKNRLSGYES